MEKQVRVALQNLADPRFHPYPLGESRLAGLVGAAFRAAGHETWDVGGARWSEAAAQDGDAAAALIAEISASGRPRPDAWVTVGPSAGMPDRIGPRVGQALGIPYIVAQPALRPDAANDVDAGVTHLGECLAAASLTIAFSSAHVDVVSKRFPDYEQRFTTVPPFINAAAAVGARHRAAQMRAWLTTRLGLPPSSPWLLALGPMTEGRSEASFRLLADAMTMVLPLDWCLIVAGDGPRRAAVEAVFQQRLRSRIRCWPVTTGEDVTALMNNCDLLVWPAIDEVFYDFALEAQAARVAVVAGKSPGAADTVVNSVTGMLVKPGNAPAIANAVGFLLRQPEFRQSYAQRGVENVLSHHDVSVAARRLDSALQEAAERHRARQER